MSIGGSKLLHAGPLFLVESKAEKENKKPSEPTSPHPQPYPATASYGD